MNEPILNRHIGSAVSRALRCQRYVLPVGLLLCFASSGAFVLLSVLFWHAPMLVWWHGQGVAQSLFSSALAIWRNKGAFTVYSLAWLGVMMLLLALTGALQPLFGSPEVAALALQPVTLLMMAAFYISAYFSYADCLATRGDATA